MSISSTVEIRRLKSFNHLARNRARGVDVTKGLLAVGHRPVIVGIGGTTRSGSSSEKALMVSLMAAEEAGADTVHICGPALNLPMYAPEKPERSDEARRFLANLRKCE